MSAPVQRAGACGGAACLDRACHLPCPARPFLRLRRAPASGIGMRESFNENSTTTLLVEVRRVRAEQHHTAANNAHRCVASFAAPQQAPSALTHAHPAPTPPALQGIFDSISCGILIYVVLVELINPLMTQSAWLRSRRWWVQVLAFAAFWSGAGLMALIGMWV